MSKRTKLILGVIGVLVVGLGGVLAFGLTTAAAEVETGVAQTDTLSVKLIVSGEVASGLSVDVFAGTQGIVDSVEVEDGDDVAAGDILATLETDALKAQVDQAKAAVAQAKAGLAQAKAGLAQANGQKGAVAAGIKAAETAVNAAKNGLDSAVKLRDAAKDARALAKAALDAANPMDPVAYAAAQQAYAEADMAYQQARGGVDAARVQVAQAESGLAQAKSPGVNEGIKAARDGVAAAEASVAAAKTGLNLAQQSLADAEIVAPISGKVEIAPTAADAAAAASGGAGQSSLAAGSVITPGAPVFTVVDPTAMTFELKVDESEVGKLQLGQVATITLNAFPGAEFTAEVTRIGNRAGSTLTGGTVFPVELSITGDTTELKAGMKGDATITISEETSALTIPIQALFSEGAEDFVYAVDADGVLSKTTVEIGTLTDTAAEVLSGLSGGETVAFAGSTNLMDGMRVKATNSAAE